MAAMVQVESFQRTRIKPPCSRFLLHALGNNIRDKETIAVPLAGEYHEYRLPICWGRVNHMRYPDGEVVSYYASVWLESVFDKAFITSSNADYVHIGYDGFGARKYLI